MRRHSARPAPPPASLEEASDRADIRWCLACGVIRSGPGRCRAWGGYCVTLLGFSDLYEAYAGPLRWFVRRLAADRGLPESRVDTDGVVHDTFMVLLAGSREPVRNPGAWLFTVARNKVRKAAAAQRRIAPGDPAVYLYGGGAAWSSLAPPAADAEEIRAAREVMRAIAGLPGHQKIATYLRQVEGWTLAEVGAYLNCAASTAGVHISRGTTKVRSALSASADDGSHDGYWDVDGYYSASQDHSGHWDTGHWDTGHGGYGDQPAHPAQGPAHQPPDHHDYQLSPGAQSGPRGYPPPGRRPYQAGRPQASPRASLLRRRRRARRGALAAAGALTGTLLAAATALALGMPWWLAGVTAAGILVISVAAGHWWRRKGDDSWSSWWLLDDFWWLLEFEVAQRRFNRWLRTGRPLGRHGSAGRL